MTETSTGDSLKKTVDDRNARMRSRDYTRLNFIEVAVVLFFFFQLIGVFLVATAISDVREEVKSLRQEHSQIKQNMYSVTRRCESIYTSKTRK